MPRFKTNVFIILPFVLFVYFIYGRSSSPPIQLQNKSIPSGRSEREGLFEDRRKHVEDVCGASNQDSSSVDEGFRKLASNPDMLRNVIVSDRHKLLYCYVPKVACTNWKRIMLILNESNVTEFNQIPSDSVHRKNVFVKLSDMEADEILHRLKTYDKFLFVRHPMERVLSAFRNKFEKNYTSSAYFKARFGVTILKKYRPNESISPTGDGVKFWEFVQFMIDTYDKDPNLLNEHWAPFTNLCHPCQMRYNLIGKYETLEEDAAHILQKVGAPKELHFPPVIESKTTSALNSYLSTLSEDRYGGLKRVLDLDFRLFDYSDSRLVNEGSQGE